MNKSGKIAPKTPNGQEGLVIKKLKNDIGFGKLGQIIPETEKYIKRNVGYMEGLILHFWHGKKTDRKYQDRGQILVEASFDVEKDIKKDWQGLYQLNEENIKLRDGIKKYFSGRNEDSMDI